jgi:glycosyltransferase involved in cell wall biosynthesis
MSDTTLVKRPKVSVLIPAYNAGRFLGETIESVINQTFDDFELIIVDNQSTDDTAVIVEQYKDDKRVSYHKNSFNVGMAGNHNMCLLYANGEYIKILCADDKLHAAHLEKFVKVLDEHNDVSLVSSHFQSFGENTNITAHPFSHKVNGKEVLKSNLLNYNMIGTPTQVMFRRKDLWVGSYRVDIRWGLDQDMCLRLLHTGNYYCIPEVLSYFRVHQAQGTQEAFQNFSAVFDEYIYLKNVQLSNQFNTSEYASELASALKRKVYNIIDRVPDMLAAKRHDLIGNTLNYIHYERIYVKGYAKIAYVVFKSFFKRR